MSDADATHQHRGPDNGSAPHDSSGVEHETHAPGSPGHASDHGPEQRASLVAPTGHEPQGLHDKHAGGHDKHAGHSVAMFRDRFWVSLIMTIPVLVWSPMVQEWLHFDAPTFAGSDRIPAVFGTLVFLYGGVPFLRGGVRELRDHRPGMMSLISLALIVAFGSSFAAELHAFSLDFWWELALLVDVMLLGHWQEMKALGQASSALDALAALLPDEAELVEDGQVRVVGAGDLHPGDLVLVRSGGRVPADGVVEEGAAAFDESMITGESRSGGPAAGDRGGGGARAAPTKGSVARKAGDRVVAGTVATDSSVRVRVEAVGADTTLAGIQRLVADAQASRSRAQDLADRAAAVLFYVAVGAAAVTFIAWSVIEDVGVAVERAVTVLVISCPHALGLAIPLVIAISTATAARDGILVKDRLALERMRTVDTVLFDKTGTLTKGTPTVRAVIAAASTEDEVLRLAAAAESDSEHPLARAIVAAARARGGVPDATDFRSRTGLGVEAVVEGTRVAVGGPGLLRELDLELPEHLAMDADAWRDRGAAVLAVIRDGTVVGVIALEDEVRPESVDAIRELRAQGVRSVLITGDAREVAAAVGKDVGVDEIVADVLPQDKAAAVAERVARGERVAMVGDGVNDAPALASADVGIAIGAGTDVAIESAGVVLASDDPRGVVSVRRLSQASYRKMLQNLGWAVGYNVVAIPLAAGALAWAGVVLAPAVGAIAMSLSTIVVALNAQLLRRLDLRVG